MNLIFAGTPDFAVSALEGLRREHRIMAVYTQPDRPAGRGRALKPSPVKMLALQHGIPVEQPVNFRDNAAIEHLRAYLPDVMVVVAYGLILPEQVLAIPRHGCINIHASLLPRWRGAAPIQRAIQAGDAVSGVTIMKMDAGLDTGPMLQVREVALDPRETAGSLHDRLAVAGAELIVGTLAAWAEGSLAVRAQSTIGVTYASKITKSEAVIDWSAPAIVIDRQIRAFNPVPGAETLWSGQQLKVWEAFPEEGGHEVQPGEIARADARGIRVATGAGLLRLTRIQLAGRKPVSAAEFLNAHGVAGMRFGALAGHAPSHRGQQ